MGRAVPCPVRQAVGVEQPYRILTVCTGNICRSPVAEVVLRSRLDDAGLGGRVVVDSGGTSSDEEGAPVDRRARAVLAAHGYDVPRHVARQVEAPWLGQRDLVLAMTAQHARWLRRRAPEGARDRVRLYRSFDPAAPAGAAEEELDIADPWYGGPEDFEATLAEVEAGADAVVEHVRRELGAREA